MEWIISLVALLPVILLFGNGRYLLATAVMFLIPLWFFSPVFAVLGWLCSCWVALRRPTPRLRRPPPIGSRF
ncbi:MAG: hypothetical protein OIF57_02555 [Marinobacterium sp.]|nr:hypothetical protein [Marinobacterium sp.]